MIESTPMRRMKSYDLFAALELFYVVDPLVLQEHNFNEEEDPEL
jgi:hypothetical protein